VVVEAEERQVGRCVVGAIAIEMSDLPALERCIAMKAETDGAPAPA